MRCVVSEGGVPWVCGLLDSEHTVMTNEGLIALNLLATLNNGEYLNSLHLSFEHWENLRERVHV